MNRTVAIISAVALALTVTLAEQGHDHSAQGKTSPPPADKQIYGQYLLIQNALAGDSLKGVPEAAATIAKLARSESRLPTAIAGAADTVGNAKDLAVARTAFNDLSDALIAHRKTDKALAEQFYVVHCPMAFDGKGASWLQATKTVSNPYFGASMLRCGAIKN